jgi:hypothetical protein
MGVTQELTKFLNIIRDMYRSSLSTEQVPHAFNKITMTIREDLVIPIAGKILARITLGTKFEIHIYYEICNCTTKSIVYPYYFDTISIV